MKLIIVNVDMEWYDVLSLVLSYLESEPTDHEEIVSDGEHTFYVKRTPSGALRFVFGNALTDEDLEV